MAFFRASLPPNPTKSFEELPLPVEDRIVIRSLVLFLSAFDVRHSHSGVVCQFLPSQSSSRVLSYLEVIGVTAPRARPLAFFGASLIPLHKIALKTEFQPFSYILSAFSPCECNLLGILRKFYLRSLPQIFLFPPPLVNSRKYA